MWKRQYLSKGGRRPPVKSTQSNLPIYFISLFVIPKRVVVRFQKDSKGLFVGREALEQKLYLVNWSIV